MKKIIFTFLVLFMMILFVACSDDSSSNDNSSDNTAGENQTSETENEAVDTNDAGNTDQPKESTPDNDSQNADDQGTSTMTDTKQILRNSAEAMMEVTSYLAEGEYIDDTTMNGQNDRAETSLSMEMVLEDSTKMYAQSTTTSSTDVDGNVEMYLVDEGLYVQSEGQWMKMPSNADSGQMADMFKLLEAEHLEEYVNQGDYFDVTDNGDHYLLTFVGDDEQYKSIMTGTASTMLEGVLDEHYENMTITGTYQLEIEKDTYYLTGYDYEYESTTTGEVGDVNVYHKANYKVSKFNEVDDITVPQEVVDQAQSIGN